MKGNAYTIFYATALGVVCAFLLTAVSNVARPHIQANTKADEIRNILAVLEVPLGDDLTPQGILSTFEKDVRSEKLGDLDTYVFDSEDGIVTAVPFSGQGLWGPIKGFLALEADGKTIKGVTFHEQQETPGLGGEIASEGFRNRFSGRTITTNGVHGIRILRLDRPAAPNEVDAITGATMTCEKVESMINSAIERILKEDVQ